jgi:DNA-binding response OmpR family regulator
MPRVLLVDDDPSIRDGLELGLRRQGHQLATSATGEDGLAQIATFAPEIVVLDLMLPGMDGFEVCRRVRATVAIPIIMFTARGDDLDIVSGLEAGADDYVVKPVQPRVLDARIRAVLRRADLATGRESHRDLVIDRAALVVTKAGRPVALTATELRVLLELSRSPGRVLSRQQLLQAVWEHD